MNEMLLDREPLLKAGGKDSRLDAGDVRKGRDCRRFCGVDMLARETRRAHHRQPAYVTVFCEALGASYGDVAVAVSIFVPTPLLRRRSPVLREHAGRGREGDIPQRYLGYDAGS